MFSVKIIKSYRDVVAVCDSNLVGKSFEDEGFQLNVKADFFKEREIEESELVRIMENMSLEDATFNIVGENSIKVAIKAGIISEEQVKSIENVPFALVLA